jgi:hypothetical protein
MGDGGKGRGDLGVSGQVPYKVSQLCGVSRDIPDTPMTYCCVVEQWSKNRRSETQVSQVISGPNAMEAERAPFALVGATKYRREEGMLHGDISDKPLL